MNILGVETSCDETAAAVVNGEGKILSNLVLSQLKEHKAFGGVVPEVAARAHLDYLHPLIEAAMEEAGLEFSALDGVAATCGPGLIGGVMVGMLAAKAIAAAHGKPFLAVNHLEGHALTPRLTDGLSFPYLLLLISGGHSQILAVEGPGAYRRWGTTIDDAAGECFDKSAKLMGLPYPGGPELQKIAGECDDPARAAARFPLPRPLIAKGGTADNRCDFSFSGLKTAVRTHVEKLPEGALRRTDVADLACAFQVRMADILANRCGYALERFRRTYPDKADPVLVVSGGVAANTAIRQALEALCLAEGFAFYAPPLSLCGDNAAMIAWAGLEKLRLGLTDSLDFRARPRWPLDPGAAPRQGGGIKA